MQEYKINYWQKIVENATSENGLYDVRCRLKTAFIEKNINEDEFRRLNNAIDDKIYVFEKQRKDDEQERLNITNMSIIACLCG